MEMIVKMEMVVKMEMIVSSYMLLYASSSDSRGSVSQAALQSSTKTVGSKAACPNTGKRETRTIQSTGTSQQR